MEKFNDGWIGIHQGDCRDMSFIPDGSVQCVVTSPPYWGLRRYSGDQELVWGCRLPVTTCKHKWEAHSKYWDNRAASLIAVGEGADFGGKKDARGQLITNTCSLCGAWRGAYGLEPTPEMYVQHTIEILREIRRVLRKDGCVFLNLGDSYMGGKGQSGQANPEYQAARQDVSLNKPYDHIGGHGLTRPSDLRHPLLKPKDLCLIPFRVAIAAQEDGWWVRSVIIWSKPNPMPESVQDRPTESHEYIIMLTKSARYYWDADAVREPHHPDGRKQTIFLGAPSYEGVRPDLTDPHERWPEGGRNIRSVWEFPTEPYPEAHFAVFPEALPEKCILVATPPKCCAECGAPWERVTVSQGKVLSALNGRRGKPSQSQDGRWLPEMKGKGMWGSSLLKENLETIGWRPTCKCGTETKPALVLDPFAGAGTVGKVAKELGRRAILIDISEEYCKLAQKRIEQVALPMELGI